VAEQDQDAPRSVHLCSYPQPDDGLIDERLSRDMEVVTATVSAALGIRNAEQVRVRQPLPELIAVTTEEWKARALERFERQILDELNVKQLTLQESTAGIERYELRPDMSELGPQYRDAAGRVAEAIRSLDPAEAAAALERGRNLAVNVDGMEHTITPDQVRVERRMPANLASAEVDGMTLILDTEISPELQEEGWARDTVRHVQQYRKERDFNIEDRIHLRCETDSGELADAIEKWRDYIMGETLALTMEPELQDGEAKAVEIGDATLRIQVERTG
ncbi:MAG: DUF5915 domain-containing protein, partial [Candidatus Brocadiaceae bacterium]|jgi:isoleucyl-tRNA synthetase